MSECPKCGYVLQPFDHICPRCVGAATRPAIPPETRREQPVKRDRRLVWAVTVGVGAVAAFVAVWLVQPRAPRPSGGVKSIPDVSSTTAVGAASQGGVSQNQSASSRPGSKQVHEPADTDAAAASQGQPATGLAEGSRDRSNGGAPVAALSCDGMWSGLTSEGQEISFTVEAGAIAHIKAPTKLRAGDRYIESTTEHSWPKLEYRPRIAEAAFRTDGEYPVFTTARGTLAASYVITGSFASPHSASGRIEVQPSGEVSLTDMRAWSATWTASRP